MDNGVSPCEPTSEAYIGLVRLVNVEVSSSLVEIGIETEIFLSSEILILLAVIDNRHDCDSGLGV